MVIDPSALLAILQDEPERRAFWCIAVRVPSQGVQGSALVNPSKAEALDSGRLLDTQDRDDLLGDGERCWYHAR